MLCPVSQLYVTGLMTFMFVFLIKYNCMKIVYCWLGFSVLNLLGAMGGLLFWKLLQAFNVGIDYLSFSFILWNFAIGGIAAIFKPDETPEVVTHGYLVCVSVFLAFVFNNLPQWTCWMLLAFLIIYDLLAVLCPHGPLRMLVDVAIDNNTAIPGLLYDASVDPEPEIDRRPLTASASGHTISNRKPNPRILTPDARSTGSGSGTGHDSTCSPEEGEVAEGSQLLRPRDEAEEALSSVPEAGGTEEGGTEKDGSEVRSERFNRADSLQLHDETETITEDTSDRTTDQASGGRDSLKLGLGDFVFYSVLVGRASDLDMSVTVSCFLAVVTGLCSTLFLLAIVGKALPALPISLALGICIYFLAVGFTNDAVNQFVDLGFVV